MIRHICMFTLQEDNREKSISKFFERAEKLRKLKIIKKSSIVRNAEKTPDSNYDVALIFDFETVETLEEYQSSPQHLEFGDFISSVRVNRACIDYEITEK